MLATLRSDPPRDGGDPRHRPLAVQARPPAGGRLLRDRGLRGEHPPVQGEDRLQPRPAWTRCRRASRRSGRWRRSTATPSRRCWSTAAAPSRSWPAWRTGSRRRPASRRRSPARKRRSRGGARSSPKRRKAAAARPAEGHRGGAAALGMPKVSFRVLIRDAARPDGTPVITPYGRDSIEFVISPNLGEPFKRLRAIASGGELSRVMLAIKGTLAESDHIEHADLRRGGRGHRRRGGPVGRGAAGAPRRRQAGAVRHAPRHHRRARRQSPQDREGDAGGTHRDARGQGDRRRPPRGDRADAGRRPHGRAVPAARGRAARALRQGPGGGSATERRRKARRGRGRGGRAAGAAEARE